MNLLDQLPPTRSMNAARYRAARQQLVDVVEQAPRAWWHLGRNTIIALVIGLTLTGGAAAAVLTPTPTTIPSPSSSAAVAPPSGAQSLSGVSFKSGQPLVHMGAPTISSVATRPCTSSDLVATLAGAGPENFDLATSQEIVSLSSTSPCYVSGYAQLRFSSETGTQVETGEINGGYEGAPLDVSNVTLSPTDGGSFLFQYTGTENGATSSCPLETSLSIAIPNQSLTVDVNVDGTAQLVCGTVNVSPIIQGDSIDRYVP